MKLWPKKKEPMLSYTLDQLSMMLAAARLSEHVLYCPLCSASKHSPGSNACARYAVLMSESTFPPVPVNK